MPDFLKRHAETIVVAFVTAAVTAAAPAIASGAGDADTVDGFHAVGCAAGPDARARSLVATCRNGYLPNGLIRRVPNSERLAGFPPSDLTRVGYAASSSSTTRVGKNGRVIGTSITVPIAGFLLIHASSDTYNAKASDLLACTIVVSGQEVLSSRRWFVVNGIHSDEDCATDAVVPVTKPGEVPIELDAMAVDSPKTAFGRTVVWAFFTPFGATGDRPQP